jgi:hypothetical protein
VVLAPFASGRLLDVVAAVASGTPQRSLHGRSPVSAWIDGVTAWCGAAAYLAPGVVIFGGTSIWLASAHVLATDARDAVFWGLGAAALAYILVASALAAAAVVEFAVRRRPAGMFDVTGLVDRLVRHPGFAAAWARTVGLVGVAVLVTALARWMAPLSPVATAMLGSFALFLAEVPAAFVWGTIAHDSYGLLASVPEADAPAPASTAAASSRWH